MRIIAIDPGVSGGIAWRDLWNGHCQCVVMPETERDLWDQLQSLAQAGEHDCFAYIERLGAMPRDEQGRAKQSPTTMFTMGANYGKLRMALIAAGIPFEEIGPTAWQRTFGLKGPKGETRTEKKNRHKQKAQQLFPNVKVTHAVADALLICEYGRRLSLSLTPGGGGE